MLSLVTQKVTQKVLQQPSSANKKKQYEIHNVLGTGSFGKVVVRRSTPSSPPIDLTDSLQYNRKKRATWTVPAEQLGIAERGAAGAQNGNGSPRPPPSRKSSGTGSGEPSPVVTHEVALKIIAKKKVKGNEESVWGEMDVLRGLDHPNIVAFPTFPLSLSYILLNTFFVR